MSNKAKELIDSVVSGKSVNEVMKGSITESEERLGRVSGGLVTLSKNNINVGVTIAPNSIDKVHQKLLKDTVKPNNVVSVYYSEAQNVIGVVFKTDDGEDVDFSGNIDMGTPRGM